MVFSKGKKDKFYDLLTSISSNLKEASQFFLDQKVSNPHDLKVFFETIKEYESKGDTYVHTIIKELNQAFITPIEREDILELATVLDDVLDGIEQSAALFEMYSVVEPTEHMRKFVQIIHQCSLEIAQAIELLSTKKLPAISKHSFKLKEYESNCDNLLRTAVKNLFATEKDPIKIIQYKEIYETLEEVSDSCQGVAKTLDSIIMKNA